MTAPEGEKKNFAKKKCRVTVIIPESERIGRKSFILLVKIVGQSRFWDEPKLTLLFYGLFVCMRTTRKRTSFMCYILVSWSKLNIMLSLTLTPVSFAPKGLVLPTAYLIADA